MDHLITVTYQVKEVFAAMVTHFSLKLGLSAAATFIAFFVGRENFDNLLFLYILVAIDLITGMIAAFQTGEEIQSRRALKTATKAIVYLLFFSAAYMTERIVPYSSFIPIGILSFLAITELISVTENMAKMGYAVPRRLLNQMKDLRNGGPSEKPKAKNFGNS